MSKYGNKRTVMAGVRFDSRREADYYLGLLAREQQGEISGIDLQPRYPLVVGGKRVGEYRADFRFTETATGRERVIDVKGYRTAVYRLKKKLVEALYNIEIEEV